MQVVSSGQETNEERREFREAFILLLAKSFLCPTTNNFISPKRHLPLVVDVANPRRYNWSLQIFTWIKDSIRDFQRKGIKHLSSCMFIFVVILFQLLECGSLNRYRGPEPWFAQWTTSMLDNKAASVLRKNEADYDQEERVQNYSPMTSSQVEREVEAYWPTMVFDEELLDFLGKVEEEAHKRYASQQ
ncbi:hypothetical protein PIB30_024945 [Stylosanthes scabra]|uniref:Uncharacterized protein n=1 Tax=Stylosanthes scabra TaxID=79078 RepID=A0ABU6VA47_9FABA|nr:hypothetical protein [Stylosanthes scabra]